MDNGLAPEAGFEQALGSLREQARYRQLRAPRGLDLASNDYLGLARSAVVRQAMVQALEQGAETGSTGSRLLSGERPAFTALESRFARWQGQESSLYFSSGYSANLGLLTAVIQEGDLVLSDRLNHASLIDGLRLARGQTKVLPHLDLDAYAKELSQADGPSWVVVESVYSMDGDLAPLTELAQICQDHGAGLIVDEAHGTGLYGPSGQGRVAELGLQEQVTASLHTCGKSLGLAGAFIAGSQALRELLINRARSFIYSTAPPPFFAAGIEAALDELQADPARRSRPLNLAERLRLSLADRPEIQGGESPIVPVILGSEQRALAVAEALQDLGYDLRAIRPPTVAPGTSRLRLVTGAHLQDDDIDRLALDLSRVLEAM